MLMITVILAIIIGKSQGTHARRLIEFYIDNTNLFFKYC